MRPFTLIARTPEPRAFPAPAAHRMPNRMHQTASTLTGREREWSIPAFAARFIPR